MFSKCSNGSCGPAGIWWSFQMKVWTLMIQRNSMILTIPWSQIFHDPQIFKYGLIQKATFSYSSQLFSFLMFPWKRKFPPPSTFCFFLSLCKYFPSSSWAKLCVSRVIWSAFSLHELLIQRCLEQNNFCQGLECKISHGQRKIKEMKRFKSKRIIDFKC